MKNSLQVPNMVVTVLIVNNWQKGTFDFKEQFCGDIMLIITKFDCSFKQDPFKHSYQIIKKI